MNIKVMSVIALLAMSSVFAAEPAVAPAAPVSEPAAPAVSAPAAESASAPAVESSAPIEAAPAASAETAAVTAVEPVAPAESPVATAVPAAEPVVASEDDASAPMAVRGGEAPATTAETAVAESSDSSVTENGTSEAVAAPAPTATKTVTKVIYQPVYTSEPTPVRGGYVQTVYVAQAPSKDTVTFDELRGFVPMKYAFGITGKIGSTQLYSDDDNYYSRDLENYSGIDWRVGAFGMIPLNEYTVGLKLGVMYEQNEASASTSYGSSSLKGKFKQSKVNVPVLMAVKSSRSNFLVEIGAQVSVPVRDEFKATIDGETYKIDMIDKDFRSAIDWDLVFGFEIRANKYVSVDFLLNAGLNQLYDTDGETYDMFNTNTLSSASFLIGLSFYLL